jgi:hypothetical protein
VTPSKRYQREPGEWRPLEELISGREDTGRSGLNTFRPQIMRWRRQMARTGRRSAAIGLAVTFVLLFSSQWLSWANVGTDGPGQSSGVGVGIDGGPTILVLAYYLIWAVVLALAGATVYAPRRARHALFGAAVGAIAVQFVAIVPLLRHPKGLVGVDVTNLPQFQTATELVVTRQAGMFCAVAALVVLAFSMVLAVGGDVVPPIRDESADQAVDALDLVEGEPSADDEAQHEPPAHDLTGPTVASTRPSSPVPVGHLEVDGLTVESVEMPPEPPNSLSSAEKDHSAYVRPLGNEQYRR